MALAADLIAKQREMLALMGTRLVLTDSAGTTRDLRGAIIPFGKDDGPLIQSIGIEGRKVQFEAITPPPKKYDTITEPVSGMVYAVQDVRAAVVAGTLIGYVCVVSG